MEANLSVTLHDFTLILQWANTISKSEPDHISTGSHKSLCLNSSNTQLDRRPDTSMPDEHLDTVRGFSSGSRHVAHFCFCVITTMITATMSKHYRIHVTPASSITSTMSKTVSMTFRAEYWTITPLLIFLQAHWWLKICSCPLLNYARVGTRFKLDLHKIKCRVFSTLVHRRTGLHPTQKFWKMTSIIHWKETPRRPLLTLQSEPSVSLYLILVLDFHQWSLLRLWLRG